MNECDRLHRLRRSVIPGMGQNLALVKDPRLQRAGRSQEPNSKAYSAILLVIWDLQFGFLYLMNAEIYPV